jgi:segregation and condensation protein B
MQTLLDRGLVRIAGRADIPGRPLLYETSQHFMEHFGLKNLDDLPNSLELRKLKLPTAEKPPEETAVKPDDQPAADSAAPAASDSSDASTPEIEASPAETENIPDAIPAEEVAAEVKPEDGEGTVDAAPQNEETEEKTHE